ncbi:MAG TPA: monofunctional biosynthetic peptidoglycan transglycosylase [Deltaproteobacteria bacterium]|nr:monofunctional biosynthetic peptidoglycan transglycosylase [Deltaproteobacteria bacterium]HQI81102.1 monofunctional biosynthetic peptidoglycan transglycosylase [Deltaproteobacteria bacterium]
MLKKLFLAALAVAVYFASSILVYFVYPDVSALRKDHPDRSAFMEYRERQWEHEGRDVRLRHRWVPLKRISPYLIKAVIIAEDDKFWRHEGFDYEAMQQAFERDLKARKLKAGGSTISQQLAKNLYLSPSKNPIRKIREAILTWRMEKTLTKRRIMELYLNYAEWGDGIFGIEAAARHYYGKHASALGPEEASRLATVLPNPIRYSPKGNSKYVRYRSKRIYRIMVARGIVIPEFEEVMTTPDEPGPEAAGEVLTGEATTTGIEQPPVEGAAVQPEGEGQAEVIEGQSPDEAPAQDQGTPPAQAAPGPAAPGTGGHSNP